MARSRMAHVLVVDDHEEMTRLLAERFGEAGHRVTCASGGKEALAQCRIELPDVVVTDLRMADVDGLDVVDGLLELDPDLPVLLMTAFGTIDTAIEAIKRGAFHYLTKPFTFAELRVWVDRALAHGSARREHALLRREVEQAEGAGALVGRSAAMAELQELVRKLGPSPAPVLVTGESGVGKEVVARALHQAGPRRARPFVTVSCRNLDEHRLDSDLFGHAKGAFPGASAARRGLLVEADEGTLFLDEIGDAGLAIQTKLLRVIEDGIVRPVGSDTIRRVDVRILASTNQPLERRVEEGRFRNELYFRLNVLRVPVPPLRERRDDVPDLVARFVAKARLRNPSTRARRFSPEALKRLAAYAWPGNVRELENLVERLVILAPGEDVTVDDLDLSAPVGPSPLDAARDKVLPLRQLELEYIQWAIARFGGNKSRAADALGIDLSTIYRKLERTDPGKEPPQ